MTESAYGKRLAVSGGAGDCHSGFRLWYKASFYMGCRPIWDAWAGRMRMRTILRPNPDEDHPQAQCG